MVRKIKFEQGDQVSLVRHLEFLSETLGKIIVQPESEENYIVNISKYVYEFHNYLVTVLRLLGFSEFGEVIL